MRICLPQENGLGIEMRAKVSTWQMSIPEYRLAKGLVEKAR
jgi:hypothetical protein